MIQKMHNGNIFRRFHIIVVTNIFTIFLSDFNIIYEN